MKPRTEHRPHRRAKLPPLLDIDEDGVPVADAHYWNRPRWSSDEDDPSVQVGDWPADLDD